MTPAENLLINNKMEKKPIRTPNSETSPDQFYEACNEAIARYEAKIVEFNDNPLLTEYYSGRRDATKYLMDTFNILFYPIPSPEIKQPFAANRFKY